MNVSDEEIDALDDFNAAFDKLEAKLRERYSIEVATPLVLGDGTWSMFWCKYGGEFGIWFIRPQQHWKDDRRPVRFSDLNLSARLAASKQLWVLVDKLKVKAAGLLGEVRAAEKQVESLIERVGDNEGGETMKKPENAAELFDEALPAALARFPTEARAIGAVVYEFVIRGAATWTVDLAVDPPCCIRSQADRPSCSIEIDAGDFARVIKNPALVMQLYFQGKLRVTGDPMLATKLQKLFALVG